VSACVMLSLNLKSQLRKWFHILKLKWIISFFIQWHHDTFQPTYSQFHRYKYLYLFIYFQKRIYCLKQAHNLEKLCQLVSCCHSISNLNWENDFIFWKLKWIISFFIQWHHDTFQPTYFQFHTFLYILFIWFLFFRKECIVWNKHITWKSCVGWCHLSLNLKSQSRNVQEISSFLQNVN
jgi:hypothetical protein